VSALRKYTAPEEGRRVSRPAPAKDDEYEVDKILATRLRRGRRQYLILWLGYDASEATWEHEENLENAQDAIAEFQESHLPSTR
jgi:hypothetical protein